MALRKDVIKLAFILIFLSLIVKYPVQMSKFASVIFTGLTEFLFNRFMNELNLIG